MSLEARLEVGFLLRQLQEGLTLSLPQSRPMPSIGAGVHELRVRDANNNWRIVYFLDTLFVVILDVFAKQTQQTPQTVISTCKIRLAMFLAQKRAAEKAERERT